MHAGRNARGCQAFTEACASKGVVRASLFSADLQLELNPDAAAKEVTYDEATKTVRIPLAAVNDGQRRTKMVMFTCNQCGTLGVLAAAC
jgi:hypothetical protein